MLFLTFENKLLPLFILEMGSLRKKIILFRDPWDQKSLKKTCFEIVCPTLKYVLLSTVVKDMINFMMIT